MNAKDAKKITKDNRKFNSKLKCKIWVWFLLLFFFASFAFKSHSEFETKKARSQSGLLLGAEANYAAANQYPALNGLLMRSACGEISTNKWVNIFSAGSGVISIGVAGLRALVFASFARSAWLVCAERATEKNRST